MDKINCDVLIIGGGTSGVSAAYNCAKLGFDTILVEKNIHLGGTLTSSLVTPIMKTSDLGLNIDFYNKFIDALQSFDAQHTFKDGNSGWVNPEYSKIVLDKILTDAGVKVLFKQNFCSSCKKCNTFHTDFSNGVLSLNIESEYIVDATGNGIVAKNLGNNFLPKEGEQALTLRFSMANVDMKKFSSWLLDISTEDGVTSIDDSGEQIHLSTAYTWDNDKNWHLEPVFKKAIEDGVLKEEDSAYFQIFTIPKMPTTITFNCPRIKIEKGEDINNPFDYSRLMMRGREQITRIARFCNRYLKGFEKAYISNIADMLGVRESNRLEGKHVFSADELNKKVDNPALACDYPFDIHSNSKDDSVLEHFNNEYYLPIESLMSKDIDNLFFIGRCLSASFKAQSTVRTQKSCFSMGEAVAKFIFNSNKN